MMQVNIPWGMPKLCNSTTGIVAMILPLKGPQKYPTFMNFTVKQCFGRMQNIPYTQIPDDQCMEYSYIYHRFKPNVGK